MASCVDLKQLEASACLVGVTIKLVSCDGTLKNASFLFRLLISNLEDPPQFHLIFLMLLRNGKRTQ